MDAKLLRISGSILILLATAIGCQSKTSAPSGTKSLSPAPIAPVKPSVLNQNRIEKPAAGGPATTPTVNPFSSEAPLPISAGVTGDVIVCPNQAPRALSLYELERFDKTKTVDLNTSGGMSQYIDISMKRMEAYAPTRVQRMKTVLATFFDTGLVQWTGPLNVIGEGNAWLPEGCKLQSVIERVSEKNSRIDKALWEKLSPADQAATVMQIVVGSEGRRSKASNNIAARRFVRTLFGLGPPTQLEIKTAITRLADDAVLEHSYENGDVVFFTNIKANIDGGARISGCGYVLKSGESANECSNSNKDKRAPFDFFGQGTKKILIIFGSDSKAVWRVNPTTLGLPSNTTSFSFPQWDRGSRDIVSLIFSDDMDFTRGPIRITCKANNLVRLRFSKEVLADLQVPFSSGQFVDCTASHGSITIDGQTHPFPMTSTEGYYPDSPFMIKIGENAVRSVFKVGRLNYTVEPKDSVSVDANGKTKIIFAESQPIDLELSTGKCRLEPKLIEIDGKSKVLAAKIVGTCVMQTRAGKLTSNGARVILDLNSLSPLVVTENYDTPLTMQIVGQSFFASIVTFTSEPEMNSINVNDKSYGTVRVFSDYSEKLVKLEDASNSLTGRSYICYMAKERRLESNIDGRKCETHYPWRFEW